MCALNTLMVMYLQQSTLLRLSQNVCILLYNYSVSQLFHHINGTLHSNYSNNFSILTKQRSLK